MADWIDELVQESIDKGPQNRISFEKCQNEKCHVGWHGFARSDCPGSFNMDVEAIQNQGVIDWTQS